MTTAAEPPARTPPRDGPVHELLAGDDATRSNWVARYRPTDDAELGNWWQHLLLVVTHHTREDMAHRAGWVGVHLWAVRDAERAGALTAQDAARRTATFATAVRELDPAGAVVDALPTADTIVEDCLRHLPAAGPTDPGARSPRPVKVLVAAAAPHLGRVRDPELAARLADWIDAAIPGRR